MRAVQVCRSALSQSTPRLRPRPRPRPRPLNFPRGLSRSAPFAPPQITPAPWSRLRPFSYNSASPISAFHFNQPRQASFFWGAILVACAIGSAAAIQLIDATSEKPVVPPVDFSPRNKQGHHHTYEEILDVDTPNMSSESIPPGHHGNLTQEQEAKLREMWTVLFKLLGIKVEGDQLEKAPTNPPESPTDAKKKRRTFFGFGGVKNEETPSADSASASLHNLSLSDAEDKYGQNKEFKQALADITPEQLRKSLWSMVKADHPDALVLRFLRARKWDVNRAVVMLISTIRWRLVEMRVDDDIMAGGEPKAIEMSESSDFDTKKLGEDFMTQMRMGKSFVHRVDKIGRPVCLIRVRMHKIGAQSAESTERYTVHMIETARLMIEAPVETAVIAFDMTGFTLANMDYTPVKFIIKCFEANYPESLGAVLIHQAPWIFSGIWKIIKGWLDPVVAAKVHFTNSVEDLEQFIDRSRILKELGGDDDGDFEYIEVQPGENDLMKDTAKRDEIIAKNYAISQELQDATKSWIEAAHKNDQEAVKASKAKREELAEKYMKGYWELDPYIRARSLYDRNGVIQPGGKINFYPEKKATPVPSTPPDVSPTAAEEKIGAIVGSDSNETDTGVPATVQ